MCSLSSAHSRPKRGEPYRAFNSSFNLPSCGCQVAVKPLRRIPAEDSNSLARLEAELNEGTSSVESIIIVLLVGYALPLAIAVAAWLVIERNLVTEPLIATLKLVKHVRREEALALLRFVEESIFCPVVEEDILRSGTLNGSGWVWG